MESAGAVCLGGVLNMFESRPTLAPLTIRLAVVGDWFSVLEVVLLAMFGSSLSGLTSTALSSC